MRLPEDLVQFVDFADYTTAEPLGAAFHRPDSDHRTSNWGSFFFLFSPHRVTQERRGNPRNEYVAKISFPDASACTLSVQASAFSPILSAIVGFVVNGFAPG